MTEIVAVGGFGSTLRQYESLADKLHEKFGPDLAISGVNFLAALKDSERLAEAIDGKHVITHSAGAYAVAAAVQLGATPSQLDMLAPPSYDMTPRLVMNAIRYEVGQRRQREATTTDHSREKSEFLRCPQTHMGVISALGKFATLSFGAACQERGTIARVGVMKSDGIFEFNQYPASELQRAVDVGVKISFIEGDHTRFTREPAPVLDELDVNPVVQMDKQQLDARPMFSLPTAVLGKLALISSHTVLARRAA